MVPNSPVSDDLFVTSLCVNWLKKKDCSGMSEVLVQKIKVAYSASPWLLYVIIAVINFMTITGKVSSALLLELVVRLTCLGVQSPAGGNRFPDWELDGRSMESRLLVY